MPDFECAATAFLVAFSFGGAEGLVPVAGYTEAGPAELPAERPGVRLRGPRGRA